MGVDVVNIRLGLLFYPLVVLHNQTVATATMAATAAASAASRAGGLATAAATTAATAAAVEYGLDPECQILSVIIKIRG